MTLTQTLQALSAAITDIVTKAPQAVTALQALVTFLTTAI